MDYDVVIVGGGPAGLSAAIRLKQLAAEAGTEVSIAVLEKGAEIGAHILSGAVVDPKALNELLPDWKNMGAPINDPVKTDIFEVLGHHGSISLPTLFFPPLMSNHGCHIVSLGNVCRWLGEQAEALGVEIYPGFPAAALVEEDGAINGVVTGDFGLARDGSHKDGYQPGMELRGKYTLIGEGVRGSLAKQLIERFDLSAGKEPQKFGIGLKELWRVKPENHKPGMVKHTMGWPLDGKNGGGSFMYHYGENWFRSVSSFTSTTRILSLALRGFQRLRASRFRRPGRRRRLSLRRPSRGGINAANSLPGGLTVSAVRMAPLGALA